MNLFRIHLRPILGWVTVVALLTFPVLSLSGALSMFLRIPTVDGESTSKGYEKQIDVLAWSWGMSNSGTTHTGGGAGAGKANVQDFSFTKNLDSASPVLMLAALTGTIYPEATFTVLRPIPNKTTVNYEYLKLKLENVLVTSVSGGGGNAQDKLTENVTLNFSKFTLEYRPVDSGGVVGGVISAAYDIAAGSVP